MNDRGEHPRKSVNKIRMTCLHELLRHQHLTGLHGDRDRGIAKLYGPLTANTLKTSCRVRVVVQSLSECNLELIDIQRARVHESAVHLHEKLAGATGKQRDKDTYAGKDELGRWNIQTLEIAEDRRQIRCYPVHILDMVFDGHSA